MGISTVTAGRIRKGQLKGHSGEEEVTWMESLPHLALSKVNSLIKIMPINSTFLSLKWDNFLLILDL